MKTKLIITTLALSYFATGCSTVSQVAETTDVLAGTDIADKVGGATQAGGRTAAAEVMRRYPPVTNDSVTTYVNRVGQYVGLHISAADKVTRCADNKVKTTPTKGFRVAILMNQQPNAFTVPGGYVFVTTGLVSRLKSEDQLAGVLAHEMMHSMCGDDQPEDVTQLATNASGYVDSLVTKPYSRAQLNSADRAAVVALYRAGYYPNHYIRYVYENENGEAKHSAGRERTALMQKDVNKLAAKIDKTVDARRARYETFQRSVMNAAASMASN